MSQMESLKGKKCTELNGNENTTHQSFWDTGKVVLNGTFRELNVYIMQDEKFQISNVRYYLKNLKKKSKMIPKQGRWK